MPLRDATLYFIRHGETDWNREARLQGQRDIPLNPLGRVQAEDAGRRLLGLVPDPTLLDYVASPMERTRDTMERVRGALSLSRAGYRTDPRLVELTFGDWEGLTWREVRARDPVRAKARERDKWTFAPPGGESYAVLTARIAPALEAITRDTAMVAHGGVARAVLHLYGGVDAETATHVDIWQGRVLVVAGGAYRWV